MGSSIAQRHVTCTLQLSQPQTTTITSSSPLPTTIKTTTSLPKMANAASFCAATQEQSSSSSSSYSNFALQRYLMLQSQHEELRHHLDQIRPVTTGNTSLASSPSLSPTRSSTCSPFGQLPPGGGRRHHSRRTSLSGPKGRRSSSLAPIADETTLWAVAEGEQRLFDVNEGMKRALMELLNCDQVRSDSSFRMWVQCRLMDTERELRSERRRKSAP